MRNLVAVLICVLLADSSWARTITVDDDAPADFTTIQAAINDANDGDTVEIQPGTYTGDGNRDIDFLGKTITVRSINPKDQGVVAATVIDCNGTEAEQHRGFHFHNGETNNSVLDGLTVRRGYCDSGSSTSPSSRGGAIACDGAAPKIVSCIITENHASSGGGISCADACDVAIIDCIVADNTCKRSGAGIYFRFSSLRVERSIVSGNSVTGTPWNSEDGYGAGIYCYRSEATVVDCVISDNISSYVGGGFYTSYSRVTLSNCTIVGNSAVYAGGIYVSRYSEGGTVSNCIVWGNSAESGPQIYLGWDYNLTVWCCDVQGGQEAVYIPSAATLYWGPGNIEADPGFVDVGLGDYHLSADSPCIDRGDPDYMPFSGEADIDGHERIINGRVDIGADEFGSAPVPILDLWPGNLDYFVYEDYGNPPAQLLAIQNRGAGTMNWAITEDCPWLDVNSLNGECIDETDYVTVSADVSGLADGIYNCQLVVDSEGAIGGRQIIDVNLVIHGPEIELSATQFEFTAVEGRENPPDQSFIVRNGGGATLNWDILTDANWLEVIPNLGSSRGEATEVTLGVDISALTWGNYQCGVVVADANSINNPQIVSVDLHVFVGEVVQVPEDVPTIQQAIDHVLEGGTVIVADGIYTGDGNRNIDFKGKAITVRSESGPENCIIDCFDSGYRYGYRGFDFHSGEDGNSVLSGFTITNGLVESCPRYRGGGAILCSLSSPTIADCIIVNNKAIGVSRLPGSSGGGVFLDQSNPTIANCIVVGNTSNEGGEGGGIFCRQSSPIITNCTICDNFGDGIMSYDMSNPVIVNCIFWGNSYGPIIVEPEGPYYESSTPVVTFSDIQGGWLGLGNIAEDPCFVSPGYLDPNDNPYSTYDDFWVDGDYHLKSEGWRWDTQRGVWTWDEVTSRCIDAGDPDWPLGDEPLSTPEDPNNEWGENLRINMGAYGGAAEASIPPNGWAISTDYNNDGIANFTDFACWSDNYVYSNGKRVRRPADASGLVLFAQCWLGQTTWFEAPASVPPQLPGKATDPYPSDGATGARTYKPLSWRPDVYAASHDVYLGTTNPPAFLRNQTGRTVYFDEGLEYRATYYWRIDEVNARGTTTGDLWTFTTGRY